MKLVSIVMCCYNAEEFISETINSILSQTHGNFEFLIGDDCSNDRTQEILDNYQDKRIKIFKNKENLGPFKTANKLIEKANSEFIARIDSDDIALPTRLEEQVRFLEANIDIGCVGSNLILIDKSGAALTEWEYPEMDAAIRWKLMFNSAIAHPSSMFRKEFFDKINGYDVTLRAGGDYDFWVRLSKVCKLHNIQKQLIKYRVHDDSISSKKAKLQRECRTQVSSTAIMEYCGFSPRFNMAFIKTGSLLELEKLHDELNKMFSIICKRFPDTSVQLFIEADIKNILHSEISCFSYREKLNSIISSNIPINLKKRIMLAIPNKIKSILKKEKTLY